MLKAAPPRSRQPGQYPQPVFRLREKILVALALVGLLFASAPISAHAASNPRYGSIVIDAYTGQVLSEDRADKRLYPASLTKIMTLFLVFEDLEARKISLDSKLRVTRRATGMPPSRLGLKRGETILLEDAILALVTKSANDIAVTIAENLASSETQFARRMTRKAHELGMTRTEFRNASGLPNRYQHTTARDMATLARAMVTRFPDYYSYFSTRKFSYHGHNYTNHNKLLGHYNGLDGIKTGYINASGFNLVASAQREGRRIIGVVFGGRSSASRNSHMVNLLDQGFIEARKRNLMIAGIPPLPRQKPGLVQLASAQSDNLGNDARLLQVATSTKPTLLGTSRLTLASLAADVAAAEPQPDVAPEDMLSMAPIPNAKPQDQDDDAPLGAPTGAHLVLASLNDDDSGNADQGMGDADVAGDDLPDDQPGAITQLLGNWSIQVGVFRSETSTARMIKQARDLVPSLLGWAEPVVKPLVTGRGTLYRARLAGLDEPTARGACRELERMGVGCLPVLNNAAN